jgi:hypothetical protein
MDRLVEALDFSTTDVREFLGLADEELLCAVAEGHGAWCGLCGHPGGEVDYRSVDVVVLLNRISDGHSNA